MRTVLGGELTELQAVGAFGDAIHDETASGPPSLWQAASNNNITVRGANNNFDIEHTATQGCLGNSYRYANWIFYQTESPRKIGIISACGTQPA